MLQDSDEDVCGDDEDDELDHGEDKYVDEKVHQYTIKYVNRILRGSD